MDQHEIKHQPRARRRDWTLAGLDREQTYLLYFDTDNSRWAIRSWSDSITTPPPGWDRI